MLSLAKTNTKDQIIRFLKFYDGFIRTKDETAYIQFLVESSVQQSMKDFLDQKKSQGKLVNLIYKATRIMPEGNIRILLIPMEVISPYLLPPSLHPQTCPKNNTELKKIGNVNGFWSCMNNSSLVFCPLVNCIEAKMTERKLSDVKAFTKYRYLMKHIGVEIWFYNKKRSLLLVFEDTATQQAVFDYLQLNCTKVYPLTNPPSSASNDSSSTQPSNNSNNNGASGIPDIDQVTKLWANHSITNFEYLMYVNSIASRSFNDISAYPVMPWLIANYTCASTEFDNPDFFRDLSKPIGAINKHRL